ncbi:MAG TPA: type II toxin-antitoxin system PemK/MazF family toxin [Solirubrobacterales bacterium]|nr:type II toxin-antitoxin system PemK/MazF family toxin [Solirubrobacterales bacterium]
MVRGDVHAIASRKKRGHVQHGRRYAIIVQADNLLDLSTVVICPTSQSAIPATFHPEVSIAGEPTQVLCEMVGAVDGGAIGEQVAHLTLDELHAVEEGLQLVLDLA